MHQQTTFGRGVVRVNVLRVYCAASSTHLSCLYLYNTCCQNQPGSSSPTALLQSVLGLGMAFYSWWSWLQSMSAPHDHKLWQPKNKVGMLISL